VNGELHPEARTNVSVSAFGPLCGDRWAALLVHPDGHVLAAFYEPAARVACADTGVSWPLETRFRNAVRETADQLLRLAGMTWAELRFGQETESIHAIV
jgi:hypothetical protein